jgi:nicotinamidase-related amidase
VAVGPDGERLVERTDKIMRHLIENDVVVIAGQAKSHCVAWTIADLLDDVMVHDEQLVRKVHLLEDCTSPVVVPDVIDYTEQADAAFRRFEAAGMHVVRSTMPLAEWPGIG